MGVIDEFLPPSRKAKYKEDKDSIWGCIAAFLPGIFVFAFFLSLWVVVLAVIVWAFRYLF